ncbi:hypothetical protein L1987_48466 [Smallanthus sonchifolius]|uniref:Uncharacterized protein n=1 Tax=Smallanthus sonchifolius TaxID=185202 RepID=A0ACB9FRU5_9ASTR|nr:hypothetical protein L1987_48466 [Smallanthus sonchifolius]
MNLFSYFQQHIVDEEKKKPFYPIVSNAHSWTCMDIYVFPTPYRVTWDYYFISREHTIDFDEWSGKTEYNYRYEPVISTIP